MTEHNIIRNGRPPLRFRGTLIAEGTTRRELKHGPAKRWYEASLYRTEGGGYVAVAVYRTEWVETEREYRWAEHFAEPGAVSDWLYDLPVTDAVVGYPAIERFQTRQERLLDILQDHWDFMLGELLAKCGDEFAEVVK